MPPEWVSRAIERGEALSVRRRKIPPDVVGGPVLRRGAEQLAHRCAPESTSRLRHSAGGGEGLRIAPAGRVSTVRGVCVADATTHMVLDAAFGAYTDAEVPLFTELIERLPERSVTILDRNFNAYGVLHRVHDATKERHWLVRAKRSMVYREVARLGDGDTLVELQFSRKARAADPTLPPTCVVRRIEYSVEGKQFVVITSMVDAERFPAAEVAALYASRWELEMVFDDVKTEQRDAAPTLRSKLPDGVYQEIYGLFIAHNLVRLEMARAAVLLRVSPTRISFHRSLQLICDHLVCFAHTSAPSKLEDREWELRRLLQHLLLPERRSHRKYPRALKTVVARYPRKMLSQAQALA